MSLHKRSTRKIHLSWPNSSLCSTGGNQEWMPEAWRLAVHSWGQSRNSSFADRVIPTSPALQIHYSNRLKPNLLLSYTEKGPVLLLKSMLKHWMACVMYYRASKVFYGQAHLESAKGYLGPRTLLCHIWSTHGSLGCNSAPWVTAEAR